MTKFSKGKSIFRLCDIRNGKWRSQKTCGCPPEMQLVTKMNWVECDLMNRNLKNAVNLSRLGVFGLAEYWHQFRDITHDSIECHTECTQCQSHSSHNHNHSHNSTNTEDAVYTLDYSWFGKRFRTGQYTKQYAPKSTLSTQDISDMNTKFARKLNLLDVQNLYQHVWDDYTGKEYSIVNHNCKDFAEIYWDCLEWPKSANVDFHPSYLEPIAPANELL
jgi:hypothetical protein